jgi:hypothetical protein
MDVENIEITNLGYGFWVPEIWDYIKEDSTATCWWNFATDVRNTLGLSRSDDILDTCLKEYNAYVIRFRDNIDDGFCEYDQTFIKFDTKEDMVMFILRWS